MPDAHAITSFVGLQNYKAVGWKRYHKSWIEIRLEQRAQTWRCIRCRRKLSNRRSRQFVRLRDLDISEHKTWLWVPRYRVHCPTCGILQAASTIARPRARCTRRFERWLFVLTEYMPVKAVSEQEGIHWTTVKDAEIRVLPVSGPDFRVGALIFSSRRPRRAAGRNHERHEAERCACGSSQGAAAV
jgi:transposase